MGIKTINAILKDDAVSQVIGVILMISVTVILAAIVATLAMNIGGNALVKTKLISIKIDQSDSDIRVTYMGGTTNPQLSYIAITAPNGSVFITINTSGELAPSGPPVRPEVGSTMVLHGAGTNDKDHVIVVGHFDDGAIQVLLDKYV